MSFSSDLATLVGDQLSRFVTLNRHQLAGHVANLDFWMEQVRNCIDAIDGYRNRFERLKAAQTRHVTEHHTIEFDTDDREGLGSTPTSPKRAPDGELREARRRVCDAMYRFLVRCYQEGLIDEAVVREECRKLDISVAASDLTPQR